MGVGANIRNIRILRGMTQKELGIKAGFSASTADVRIRQYESEKMIPKKEKLEAIAKALDVDVSAFTNHNIDSDLDFMHIFFELEDTFGLKVGKDSTGKPILYFDDEHPFGRFGNINLDNWYRTQAAFTADSENPDYQERQYELWKCRYPLDLRDAEDTVKQAIDEKYKDLLYHIKTYFKIHYVDEFITIFEKLIKNGYEIEIQSAPELSRVGWFICFATFKTKQLLETEREAAVAYAKYLAMISQLEELGIKVRQEYNTISGEIVFQSYFYSTMLSTALHSVVREMIEAYKTEKFDDEFYQFEYEHSLKLFHLPIEEAVQYQ